MDCHKLTRALFFFLLLTGSTLAQGPTFYAPGLKASTAQNGAPWDCRPSSASGTAYTCSLTPALTAYPVNSFFDFIPDVTNTGSATLNINGLGTKTLEKVSIPSGVGAGSLVNLAANDLIAGVPYTIRAHGNPVDAFIVSQPYTQVSVNTISNAGLCPDTSVSANTITCTTIVSFAAYGKGQAVDLILANTVTGATTININSIGVKNVTFNGTTPMTSGTMVAGGAYRLEYDGTEFVLQGSVGGGGGGPTTNQNVRTIGASFGSFQSGATALSAALTSCVPVYYSGTIQAVHLIGNVSGSVTVDVQTVLHSSWTGTASVSSITASDTPALSSAAAFTDTTLTGWTTTLAANTDICFVLTSPTTVAGVSISLKVAAN